MGIKYSIKKCIENKETVNSSDKDHTKIKKYYREKRVPENIFHIKIKKTASKYQYSK